jgi:transposase
MMSEATLSTVRIGVGIDTARYGHYANFMGEDRQKPAPGFNFPESREGYQQFQAALQRLADRHGGHVHFHIRIDAAGQYAVNLEQFLRQLPFSTTISVGEPKRNKDYKNAHFPKGSSDPIDSQACARFAIVERPPASYETPAEFIPLRDVAGTLEAQSKQTTRQINQLHAHMARVFPELAGLASNIAAEWVLALLDEYPTPERIAAAHLKSLAKIPYVTQKRAKELQTAARSSTGSLRGPVAEQLVRRLVADVRHSQRAEQVLGKLLEQAFAALPEGGHQQLLTIPGIGPRNAGALVAKIVCIDRFETPEKLVNYFGFFPESDSSGVDKQGNPKPDHRRSMSAKGNDLVRGLLWMAAQTAIRWNAPVKALYARQKARGKRGDVALGHCARKLLHLVFAVWKTNQPFDPTRFVEQSGEKPQTQSPQTQASQPEVPASATVEPAQPEAAANQTEAVEIVSAASAPIVVHPEAAAPREVRPEPPPHQPVVAVEPVQKEAAAGHNTGSSPDQKEVTADSTHFGTRKIPRQSAAGNQASPQGADQTGSSVQGDRRIDFADLRGQISMTDVLRHLGWLPRMRGDGPQRRGPCPVHQQATDTDRTFSINVVKQVFHCVDPKCRAHGNALDLWAAVHRLPLYAAALDLAKKFHLKLKYIDPPNPQGQPLCPTKKGVITPDPP